MHDENKIEHSNEINNKDNNIIINMEQANEIININEKQNEEKDNNIINIEKSTEILFNNVEQSNSNNNKDEIKIELLDEIKNNDEKIKQLNESSDINKDNKLINEINEEEKIIELNNVDNINSNENKQDNKNLESKLDFILNSLKEKDGIIKSLQNDIIHLKKENESFSSQIKEMKESQNQMKQNYEKQINELKEVMAKKEDIKDIKYFAKKREIDFVRDNLDALADKYNNFERVIESKMGFLESNMTKIFEKGEELKKLEENKINNDNINKDKNNKNNNINNNYFYNEIIELNQPEKQKQLKDKYDMKVYQNYNKILEEIFSHKNLKKKDVDKKILEKFKKEGKNLAQNKHSPIDFCTEYISELKQKISKELINNLEAKKILILKLLNDINDEILAKINITKLDVNNFDIEAFRKEYGFSEKDFPDDHLKKEYLKNKGDLNALLLKLTN